MNKQMYIQTTGVIFAIIAILHAIRFVYGWQVQLGDWVIPMWLSIVGVIVAGYFAYSAFQMKK